MISGISSTGGYLPTHPTGKTQAANRQERAAATAAAEREQEAQVQAQEAETAELAAPVGDRDTLAREYTLLEVASRQYDRILPEIETLSVPVE